MAADREQLRAALAHVQPHSRETWLRMGMAVKSELGDDGYDLWDEWSQGDDGYSERDARAVWRSIQPTGKVTGGTLFYEAERNGFRRNGARFANLPPPEDLAEREERARAAQELAQRKHVDAAATAKDVLAKALPARADHPYLERKHVPPAVTLRELPAAELARLIGYAPTSSGEPLAGRVLIAPVRIGDALSTLEFIDEAGRKSALAGGAKSGGFWSAQRMPEGDGAGLTLLLAEGVATAITGRVASGQPAFAALSCGNLTKAATELRARYQKAQIIVLADLGNGERHAHEAAHAVGGLVASPDFGENRPDGATDLNDLLVHRGAEAVKRAIGNARAPDIAEHQATAPNAAAADPEGAPWPAAMNEAALHGIAGEFVRMVEPDTEADPAGLLVQFLIAFGALVGRGPHYRVEGAEHHANLFALLVGATSKGRKGTAWARVREVFQRVPGWKPEVNGASTGEGLKFNVRDAKEATKKKQNGEMVTEVVDEGVTDKRLLVQEGEFAAVLRAVERQGNTLSATVREAWDSGNLRTLTRTDPITATGAHICIVGHITADELRGELTATDKANGFANRFLFVAVKRSKELAFGGAEPDERYRELAFRLQGLADRARTCGQLGMTEGAKTVWRAVYSALSAGGDGLHGAVTARAEAQTIRLALVYALLDGAEHIDVLHLRAALAVWEYCDATAKHVFGASLGDRIADDIMRRLRAAGDAGLTRTEIRDAFARHAGADRIGAALELLVRRGIATCSSVSTGGRPVQTWRAAQ